MPEHQYSNTLKFFTIVSGYIPLTDMKLHWFLRGGKKPRNFVSGKVLPDQTDS
jgi:hypothetical protein